MTQEPKTPTKLYRLAGAGFAIVAFLVLSIAAVAWAHEATGYRLNIPYFTKMLSLLATGVAIIGWRFPDSVLRPILAFWVVIGRAGLLLRVYLAGCLTWWVGQIAWCINEGDSFFSRHEQYVDGAIGMPLAVGLLILVWRWAIGVRSSSK